LIGIKISRPSNIRELPHGSPCQSAAAAQQSAVIHIRVTQVGEDEHVTIEPGEFTKTILVEVIVGAILAVLGAIVKWQWPLIRSLFDAESRRQASQIEGSWNGHEHFADGAKDDFILKISCRSGIVKGTHYCVGGYDQHKEYEAEGRYKDHILSLRWAPKSKSALESGAIAARLVSDGKLEGHGLYVEPLDGRVYTSKFSATKSA
jgi:hypothetical protein